MRVRLWKATIGGAFAGLLFGIVLEIARQFRSSYSTRLITEEFESRGMSPPLMTDMLKPHAIPLATCALFAIVSSLVFVIWSQRNEDN